MSLVHLPFSCGRLDFLTRQEKEKLVCLARSCVQDIVDFTDLLCIVTCWENSVRKSDSEFVKSPAPKPSADDTESFPLLAHLIEVARDGSVAAKEVAKLLSEIDAKIRVRSSSPHVSDSESGRIAFQSGQDGHGAWLDDVKRCGGCFSLPLARVE